jgi:hypothetical protein
MKRRITEIQLTARAILLEADRVPEEGNTSIPRLAKSIQWGTDGVQGLAR